VPQSVGRPLAAAARQACGQDKLIVINLIASWPVCGLATRRRIFPAGRSLGPAERWLIVGHHSGQALQWHASQPASSGGAPATDCLRLLRTKESAQFGRRATPSLCVRAESGAQLAQLHTRGPLVPAHAKPSGPRARSAHAN